MNIITRVLLPIIVSSIASPMATAQIFRGTPMPEGRGCEVTHCQRMWDDRLQRPFKRCWWRCPRPARPAPEYVPAPPRYEPPSPRQYEAREPEITLPIPPELVLIGLALFAFVVIGAIVGNTKTQEIDEAVEDAAAAAAAKAKLDAATAEADALIRRIRSRTS